MWNLKTPTKPFSKDLVFLSLTKEKLNWLEQPISLTRLRGSKPYPSTYKDFDSVSVKNKNQTKVLLKLAREVIYFRFT